MYEVNIPLLVAGIVTLVVGPIVILGLVGGITGRLTLGASGGKGTLIGIGIGILITAVCWALVWMSFILPSHSKKGDILVVLITSNCLVGIISTVILVRRTRNKAEN